MSASSNRLNPPAGSAMQLGAVSMLQVAQIQFPVGHGGLHLTQLVSPWSSYPAVNVIYDCGTRSRKRVLEESLNVLQYCSFSLSRPQPHIDLLILSHLHNDHINGFEMLQQKIAPSMDRLAIPHYDDEDKLVVLAQAASSGATTRQIARLHEVLTDPAAWFGARGVRQILAVAPGSPTAEPPPSPVPPLPDDGPPEGYRLVGWPDPAPERPTTEAYVPKRASISGPSYGTYVVLPPGSVLRILSPATSTSVAFVVIPYCLRSIPGRGGHRCRQQFVQAVDRVLHPYRNGASLIIKSKHARTVLQSLKSAFVSYVGNSGTVANRLSLLSYIGFDCISLNTCFTYLQTCAPHCMPCGSIFWNFLDWSWPAKKRVLRPPRRTSTCGRLMTGDADLRRDTEWKKVFGKRLGLPIVLQAPHHGADYSFPKTVPRGTRCVFATCADRDRHHPGPKLRELLTGKHIPLHRVRTSPSTALATLHWI